MSRDLMIIFTITGQDIPGTEDMADARNASVIIAGQTGMITGIGVITGIAMTADTVMVRKDVGMEMDMAEDIGNKSFKLFF